MFTAYFENTLTKATTELWNLPSTRTPTKVTAMGAYGNQGTLILGSTASTELDKQYVFKTDDRPLKLNVQSVDESGNIMTSLNRFTVEVRDPTMPDGLLVSVTNPVSGTFSHPYLRRGMQVRVTVPQAIYFDRAGAFMYASGGDGATQTNAYERYGAAGLSINNSAPTGDATEYEAELQQDLTVKIRWNHQYALRVKQDFTKTGSRLLTEQGTHWATAITSVCRAVRSTPAAVRCLARPPFPSWTAARWPGGSKRSSCLTVRVCAAWRSPRWTGLCMCHGSSAIRCSQIPRCRSASQCSRG